VYIQIYIEIRHGNHLYCCTSLYDVLCVTDNILYCCTSLLHVISFTTLLLLWMWCTSLQSWCVTRTPPILFLSMAKTSPFHPGSPNPSNKQIMAPRKKKKVDGNDDWQDQVKRTPPEQEPMPFLRPVRGNPTPAPSTPKLLNIPGETYEDHSDPFHPNLIIQTLSLLSIWHYYQKSQLPSWLTHATSTLASTLYSCYGITANANMFPVGFAIVFGNENLLSWKEFWKFIVELHPCLNKPDVAINDQDRFPR